jgi:hypothetical protein
MVNFVMYRWKEVPLGALIQTQESLNFSLTTHISFLTCKNQMSLTRFEPTTVRGK